MSEINSNLRLMSDAYERACDSCPFQDECNSYREAFGENECLRDDWAKSLGDFIFDLKREGKDEN